MSCLLFLSVSVVVVGELVSIFKMNLPVVSLFAKPWSFSQQETHTCHMSVMSVSSQNRSHVMTEILWIHWAGVPVVTIRFFFKRSHTKKKKRPQEYQLNINTLLKLRTHINTYIP